MHRISKSLFLVIFLSACTGAPVVQSEASVPASGASVPAAAVAPADSPTTSPTEAPTDMPTQVPTDAPTDVPTEVPTDTPTTAPKETVTATPLPAPTIVDTTVAETSSNAVIGTSGDVARGAELFAHGSNGAPPCSTCHLTQEGQTGFSLGPNLAHVGERAGARVEGEDTDTYLHQSILEPNAFLVPGYRSIMYPEYGKHYSDSEIEDLIAFLKSL